MTHLSKYVEPCIYIPLYSFSFDNKNNSKKHFNKLVSSEKENTNKNKTGLAFLQVIAA